MKKSEQILAYHLLVFLTALSIFIIALVTKNNTLTPFGFILLVGGTVIRIFAKKENPYNKIIRKVTTKVNEVNPTISPLKDNEELRFGTLGTKKPQTINEAFDEKWNGFIKWLHE
jgi:hypothetical protein